MNADIPHLAPFRSLISQRFGLAMPERFDRLLPRALARAMEIAGARDAEALCLHLETQPWTAPAWQAVIETVTVRETSFFRQSGWWGSLVQAALKPLIEARRRDGTRHLRCLSLGCASGDEPYSLAMILHRLLRGEPGWTVEIVGADLCQAALVQAQAGVFDARAVQEIEPRERELWFRPAGRRLALSDELRSRVAFRLFNLAEAAETTRADMPIHAPGAPADLVICRNVIIHMEPSRQPGIARYLTAQLRPGGRLAVSPVEATAAWFAPLAFEATGQAILFTKPDGRASAPQRKARPAPPAVEPPPPPLPAAPKATPAAPDSSVRLARVRHLADLGMFEEARRLCEQILGANAEAELLMALVCQALGDIGSAEAAARRGLVAAPQSPAAHYVHAIICLRTGLTAQARRSLRRAIELLDATEEGKHLGTHLAIEAGEIRQAARRLGVSPTGQTGAGGIHGRPH
jgi:chemotaxis protein methyltransferase CheR